MSKVLSLEGNRVMSHLELAVDSSVLRIGKGRVTPPITDYALGSSSPPILPSGTTMSSAPSPTAISTAAGKREQGHADLMFSWKGVQGLLDESAALDNDDEEGGSDEHAQVVDVPIRGHAGDISFTGSELYPDDGYARGTSPTGGPIYGSTGPTTPASSRFGNHQLATTQAGLQSATSTRTDPGNRPRNRQVSRQSLLAVFNSPVSERHQGNEERSSRVGRHSITDTRSPTQLPFDNTSTLQRDGLKQRRADTDVTIRPARPTGSPSSHQTTRRNSSSSDSDTESSSGQSTDTYISSDIESQSNQEEQVLSSSPTQLDIPTPITTHPTHLPTRNSRERNRDHVKPRTLRIPSHLPTTNNAKHLLPGRRIQSQTIPSPAKGERTPLLSRAGRVDRVGSVQVPPRLMRAQTDEGVVHNAETRGASRTATKRIGMFRRWSSREFIPISVCLNTF
jgi:hypothetical protein